MRETIIAVSAIVSLLALVLALILATDWLWIRGTFCTEALLQKDNRTTSGRLECETVAHTLDLNPGSPIAVCRCKR